MKFCPECDSLLYYHEDSNILYEKCDNCGYTAECQEHVIDSKSYQKNNLQITEAKSYARYDNALPRTIHKECPNKDCPSRKNKVLQEAVYYPDKLTMKLIYICTVCNTQWQYS